MKIGKNEPCHCGSGKKYKKCCYMKTDTPSISKLMEMRRSFELQSIKRRAVLENRGIFIDFPSPTHFRGRSVWALGSRVYPNEAPNITFHEFIISVLAQELGKDWLQKQEQLPYEDRHFIRKAHDNYLIWRKSHRSTDDTVKDKLFSGIPNGWTKSLISIAFDVACVIHVHGRLPSKMLERLKLSDSNYQGARYELAVAAILARMNCKLEFLDEKFDHLKNTPGHNEFIAVEPFTNTKISVEAKSKVRKGVLHEPGVSKPHQLWSNVTGPLRDAITQDPETLPYFVFVDLNTPATPGVPILEKPWAKEVLKQRRTTSVNRPDKPDPCTAIVYTNYSYHYNSSDEIQSGEALLVAPDYPKYRVPDFLLEKLQRTLNGYSAIPAFDYSGEVLF